MNNNQADEAVALLRKLEAVIDSEKPNKQAASLAACTLLVSIAENLRPDECAVFADMISSIEREVRHGHEVQGGVH